MQRRCVCHSSGHVQRYEKPVVYAPRHKEWVDCHRTGNGGYDNVKRLSHLRKTLFKDTMSFGQKHMVLDYLCLAYGLFAENRRFAYGGIVLAGFNMPGRNNDRAKGDK